MKIKFKKTLLPYKKDEVIEIKKEKYSDILKEYTEVIPWKKNKAILSNKNVK